MNISATKARQQFFELVKGAAERNEIYHIRHPKGGAVLLSEDEYDSILETIDLLSTPGFRRKFTQAQQQAQTGDTVSFEDVFGEPQ